MDRETMVARAAAAGADVAADLFRTTVTVETKGSNIDYVTTADTRAQRRIVETITAEYPDDAIVGEEENELKTVPSDGAAWVIDPIDGTTNFVNGIHFWATSVAAVRDGDAVAAANVLPVLGDRYIAETDGVRHNGELVTVSSTNELDTSTVAPILRYGYEHRDAYGELLTALSPEIGDFRRFGSPQVSLSLVASGALDATVGITTPKAWDAIAGAHLVEQAGGTVTDVDGSEWTSQSRGIVASNGVFHDELLDVVRQALN